ncbi:MAG: dUTP diphosphatase [archaeon]
MNIKIKKLKPNAIIPKYAHHGDAGMDLFSTEDYVLNSGERKLISTGLAFEIPYGAELQIRPRSGLALKHGISIVNSPGTLDFGYRGELGVILINHGKDNFEIKKGDKIAQAILNKIEIAEIEEVEELSDTSRGEGGFGSTGKN